MAKLKYHMARWRDVYINIMCSHKIKTHQGENNLVNLVDPSDFHMIPVEDRCKFCNKKFERMRKLN